ncbi:MAG: hypothetical protein J6R32_10020 [Bacteroidales bacterium]|nr:hypothetical protein [Bacteroidales bacterium]
MKKYIIIIAVLFGFISNISAQEVQNYDTNTDGFFHNFKFKFRTEQQSEILPMLPDGYNYLTDFNAVDPNQPVPLGSGLLILTGLALTYSRRKKE